MKVGRVRRVLGLALTVVSVQGLFPVASMASMKKYDSCSYSPIAVGQTGSTGGPPWLAVTDIREVLDARGRSVAWLYLLERGQATIQGNALMSASDRRRYHLERESATSIYTGEHAVRPTDIRERVIACRANRILHGPNSSYRIQADAAYAYAHGLDFVLDTYLH